MKKIIFILTVFIIFIVKSNSQSGWYSLNSGTSVWLEQVVFVNENTGFIGSDGGFILKTTNAGVNWQNIPIAPNETYITCLQFFDTNTGILSGSLYGKVYLTTNSGVTFDSAQSNSGSVRGMHFPSRDTGYINNKYGGVFKTTNGGHNWFNVLIGDFIEGKSFFTSNNTGFISRCEGGSQLSGTLLKTTNGGLNWVLLRPDSSNCLHDVKFTDSMTGYLCGRANYYGGIVYKTTDGGNSWLLSKSVLDCEFYSICFPTSNVGYVISWNDGGKIIKTTNAGASWSIYSDTLFKELQSVYFINEYTGYATNWHGRIIKTTNGGSPLGILPVSSEIPNDFQLLQNYPNPFNPITSIKFKIANFSSTNLSIYDNLGHEIYNLVNENLNPGIYSISWDASNYPSGIYFYKITSGHWEESKKMVLIK